MDKAENTAAVPERANLCELRNKRKECPEPKLQDNEKEVKAVHGTEGRKKRAVCSTSSSAAASDGVIVTDCSGDLASIQMTLSIEHIREQIFRSLPNEDLYNCRRLCRIWNSVASLELQNRINSRFDFGRKEFSKYLTLLDKRPESMLGFPLPCSKFSFDKERYSADFLKNREMLKFLNKYGPVIKELSFRCDESQAKEKEMIDFVTNLLLHQTPNLLKLEIKLKYSASWIEGGSTRWWNSPLLETDPEFKEIHSQTWGTNTKLKVLSFSGVSAKLLEVIIKLAPNLKEINTTSYISPKNDCRYFMEPLNRLGHLKTILFQPDSVEELQVFENVCKLSKSGDTSLKLRDISFCFQRTVFGLPNVYLWRTQHFLKSPEMRVRGENVINRLLECSWDSLETIRWDPVSPLPGLKWPEVLPNVKKFSIRTLGYKSFPEGFSWSTTFPKLQSFSLNDNICHSGFTNVMDSLFQQQKIESVRNVHVHAWENWSKEDAVTGAHLKRFQNIFPNAEIDVSVPASRTPAGGDLKLQGRCRCIC